MSAANRSGWPFTTRRPKNSSRWDGSIPAYETPEELDRRRKRQQALGRPPIYDRAALRLTDAERAALEAAGRKPHWRFRLDPGTVRWTDMVRGASHIDCGSLSDPVLRREDGTFLYTLPSVVDDIAFGVTHVIRGEDHVTNTAVQLQLFEALAGHAPEFGHHNLLTDASGEGLSKRTGALSIASLRERGSSPSPWRRSRCWSARRNRCGRSLRSRSWPGSSISPTCRTARRGSTNPSSTPFRRARCTPCRMRRSRDRLAALGIAGPKAEAFWLAVRGNVARLADAAEWRAVVEGDIAPVVEDRAYLDLAAERLPEGDWDHKTWAAWTNALKALTGRKGRELYHPLRLALTGRESGPELAALLPLIGRARALARLSAPSY